MSLRCVVYARKSSKDSDENKQKYSIDRQEKDFEKYFENHRVIGGQDPSKKLIWNKEKGVDWFYEDASAKIPSNTKRAGSFHRPEFLKMLKLIKKGRFDVLICTDLSRLSRNAVDTGNIVQLLEPFDDKKKDITPLKEIRTMDKVFGTTPTDKFTLSLFMSVAKFENDQRGKNTSSGLRRKRDDGGTGGKAPVGYVNKGDEKNKKWVDKDPDNFDKCRELWEFFLSGDKTLNQVYELKNHLNIQHFWNKKNKLIADTTVREMFRNRYYTGKVLKDLKVDNVWVDGRHPAMVSDDEFQRAQEILQMLGRKHASYNNSVKIGDVIKRIAISSEYTYIDADGRKRPAPYTYTERKRYYCSCGKRFFDNTNPTHCRFCEKAFDKNTKTSLDARFIAIINKIEKGNVIPGKTKKAKNSVSLKSVIKSLELELSKLFISDNLFEVLTRRLFTLWEKENGKLKKERKALKKKEEKLEKEADNLRRKFFDDSLSSEKQKDAEIALNRVKDEIRELQEAQIELAGKVEDRFELSWQRLQVLRNAKNILGLPQFEPKKELLLSLCSNLIFDKNSFVVKWREPFDIIASANIDKNKKTGNDTSSLDNFSVGSGGRVRTDGQLVNSQLLYH